MSYLKNMANELLMKSVILLDDLKKQIFKYHKYLGWQNNNYEMRDFYDSISRRIAIAHGITILIDQHVGCQLLESIIEVTTWYESHHNGDSYDVKRHEIGQTPELLQIIHTGLVGMALAKAAKEYEQELKEEKSKQVRAFLTTKLLHMNGNDH